MPVTQFRKVAISTAFAAGLALVSLGVAAADNGFQNGASDQALSQSTTSGQAGAFGQGASAAQASSGMSKHHQRARPKQSVKMAQLALNQQGAHLKADGIMGHHTRDAIKSYQKSHHLQVSGKLDQSTRQSLNVQ